MIIISKCMFRKVSENGILLFDSGKRAIINYNLENGECFFNPNIIIHTLDKFFPDNVYESHLVDAIKNVFDKYFPNYSVSYIGERDLSNIYY